ncbi:3-dehydroquinate synthase [Prevotella brunnea]|uniref:3-dehydroquinate synthase n=1 Tax=Prevotella brunnea TaxID=2508867 RepID=A0A5C8GIX5_9BACT|nr:3-dehydroquinate synthase [Prevotella brunnea]TXJ61887.1 3-dehydroquinate synthase [Prevotella brunnea]
MNQKIIIPHNFKESLAEAIAECEHDRIFVLTDEKTMELCWKRIDDYLSVKDAQVITIPCGDGNKTLKTLLHVWTRLQVGKATRHSLLINLGGGMVTDLGGFAASTFKRGIDFINIPTTLLGMIDASVGGKTGINFGGVKNEIGAFNEARFVIADTKWLETLDMPNLLSGYAEMLKHGLISDDTSWARLLAFDFDALDLELLSGMVSDNVKVKTNIVEADPYEQGMRKALNFGHTFGHAFEALAMYRQPLLHGYAVAFGIVCELYLSVIKQGFPVDKMRKTFRFIRENYGMPDFACTDYDELIELMRHDKKNRGDDICLTLLGDIGKVQLDSIATEEDIKETLDFLREG